MQREFSEVRNQYNKLQAQLAPRTRSKALKSMLSGPLDAAIVDMAKKYVFFHHLWVPGGAFPLREYPADFDFNNPLRYRSTEAKVTAYAAEVYFMLPSSLRAQALVYGQFESLVSLVLYGRHF